MSEIKAEQIRRLRERTGCGIMDSKRALEWADGDEEKAVLWLRSLGTGVGPAHQSKDEQIVAITAERDQLRSDIADCQEACLKANEAAALANADNVKLRTALEETHWPCPGQPDNLCVFGRDCPYEGHGGREQCSRDVDAGEAGEAFTLKELKQARAALEERDAEIERMNTLLMAALEERDAEIERMNTLLMLAGQPKVKTRLEQELQAERERAERAEWMLKRLQELSGYHDVDIVRYCIAHHNRFHNMKSHKET